MENNQLIPLYALDHDLTYDLLYAENIHFKVINFLGAIPGFPITHTDNISTGLLLFERITLDGYPWAEDYSLKLFEFFKKLSRWGNYRENLDPNYNPPRDNLRDSDGVLFPLIFMAMNLIHFILFLIQIL